MGTLIVVLLKSRKVRVGIWREAMQGGKRKKGGKHIAPERRDQRRAIQ